MTTRKVTIKDIEKLAQLFDDYRIFYEKKSDLKQAEIFLSERIQKKESEIFVVETDDNNLVGFVQLYPIFSSTKMKKLWLLNDLFVDKQHRGKGISKQLIEISKELCKQTNACGLVLETAKSNEVGNKLYPQTGFVLDSEHNYYSWENN
ncbi:MAG: GNAT family N-acetyltransferase [Bacteroidetes bacterium]|nr:MAG: GNAT family N-acetyltransferase [Bacteroidota bacterium]